VVAEVGDHEITVGELADRIVAQSPYLRARYASPERRKELLNELIDFHLLAGEARRRGYDQLPEVVRARKQRMIEAFVASYLDDRRDELVVTDAEIRAYYEAHPKEWSLPEQVRASHILVATEAEARSILAELAAHPDDPDRWRALVEAHHTERRGRRSLGDLRFFSRPDEPEGPHIDPALARAAFTLEEPGDVFPEPVRTEAGWHVVRLTDRRAALRRSLDDVRRAIENQLWRDKQDAAVEALVAELAEEISYEVDEDLARRIPPPSPAGERGGSRGGSPATGPAPADGADDDATRSRAGSPR